MVVLWNFPFHQVKGPGKIRVLELFLSPRAAISTCQLRSERSEHHADRTAGDKSTVVPMSVTAPDAHSRH